MGIFHNLILTHIDYGRASADTRIFPISQDIYFSWTLGRANEEPGVLLEDEPNVIERAYKALANSEQTLLVKIEDEAKLPKPEEATPSVRKATINMKSAFQLEATHAVPTRGAHSLYYYILPEYCRCIKDGVIHNGDLGPIITSYETRQTVAFITSRDNFQITLPFYDRDVQEFDRSENQSIRKIMLPAPIRTTFKLFRDFAVDVCAKFLASR